jgi:hypothetical protein
MSFETNVKSTLTRIGHDIAALVGRIVFLERNLGYLTPMTTERSDPDTDGIYRKITHKNRAGLVIQISTIEHDPLIEIVNGLYNKRVTKIYNKAGTVVETVVYQIKYDANGEMVSETLI